MTTNKQTCSTCKKLSPENALFCQHCGSKFLNSSRDNTVSRFNSKHVLYTILILFLSEMIFSFIAGLGWYIYNPDAMEDIPKLVIVSSTGSLAGLFFGSLFASFRFAKESIREVLTGAVAAVLISKIIDIFLTKAFTPQVFYGMLISGITAFAGIMAAQFIMKRLKNKS